MGTKTNTTIRITTDNARIAGTQKYYITQPTLLVESVTYTPAQIIAIYNNDLAAIAAVAAARLALSEAVTKAKSVALVRDTFDKGYKQAITGAYGNSPATLGTFGIVLATPKPRTVEAKATALAQAGATRALRHTMGKTQKAKIKAAPVADVTSASQQPFAVGSGSTSVGAGGGAIPKS